MGQKRSRLLEGAISRSQALGDHPPGAWQTLTPKKEIKNDKKHHQSASIAWANSVPDPHVSLNNLRAIFARIGNIYRAELLYRARQNPFTPGKDVPEKALNALWRDAVKLMTDGMVDRRIVTTRAKDRPHLKGKAQPSEVHYVYRRHGQPCFVDGATIRRLDLAGRTLYWCPTCQAPKR